MGDTRKKYEELISEEEFDKLVKKEKNIDGLGVVEVFETEYAFNIMDSTRKFKRTRYARFIGIQ